LLFVFIFFCLNRYRDLHVTAGFFTFNFTCRQLVKLKVKLKFKVSALLFSEKMSKHPSGFKNQDEYNAYMRDYKAKRRTENLKHEVELLLSHVKLSNEDNLLVQQLITNEKYFEARNTILFIQNQIREKNEFAYNQEKQNLIAKYLRSDPEYQKMTPEGQHYWDLIISKHLDVLYIIISQGQFLIRGEDTEHYENLRINRKDQASKISLEMLDDLLLFLKDKMNLNSSNLKHAPKFNIPNIFIGEEIKDKK
jgi:hypothetical protein